MSSWKGFNSPFSQRHTRRYGEICRRGHRLVGRNAVKDRRDVASFNCRTCRYTGMFAKRHNLFWDSPEAVAYMEKKYEELMEQNGSDTIAQSKEGTP